LTQGTAVAALVALAIAPGARAQTTTVWDQPPGTPGLAPSQFSTDAPFRAECADDFQLEFDAEIVRVRWWGATAGGGAREAIGRAPGDRYLDCSAPELLPCGSVVSSNNGLGHYDVEWYYGCSPIWREQGPEVLYELPIPGPDIDLTLTLSDLTADLDLFLLGSCSEDDCLADGQDEISIHLDDAGTYYVVVDGYQGAIGDYTLTVECEGQPNRVFVVRIYYAHPLTHEPTDLIGETYVTDFHEEEGHGGLSSYWADITPVAVAARSRYWLSVQMLSQSATEGEWFWAQTSADVALEHPRIEDARLSADRWTSFPELNGYPDDWDFDLAFELDADETPVARTNWGLIKALYR
jgi:hypothetical protein